MSVLIDVVRLVIGDGSSMMDWLSSLVVVWISLNGFGEGFAGSGEGFLSGDWLSIDIV